MLGWTIRGTYGPGALARRAAALAAHEAYLVAHSRQIRFAGPLFADDGETRTGTWFMIDAADRAAAQAFIAAEGFNRAGMFGAIEIRRFVDASPVERRQIEIAPAPALPMFVCELVDGPAAAGLRRTTGAAHDEYLKSADQCTVVRGLSVTDDASRPLGEIAVIAVADRAAADAIVAAAPLVRAGAYAEIRVDRWRFGRSVV